MFQGTKCLPTRGEEVQVGEKPAEGGSPREPLRHALRNKAPQVSGPRDWQGCKPRRRQPVVGRGVGVWSERRRRSRRRRELEAGRAGQRRPQRGVTGRSGGHSAQLPEPDRRRLGTSAARQDASESRAPRAAHPPPRGAPGSPPARAHGHTHAHTRTHVCAPAIPSCGCSCSPSRGGRPGRPAPSLNIKIPAGPAWGPPAARPEPLPPPRQLPAPGPCPLFPFGRRSRVQIRHSASETDTLNSLSSS